MCFNKVGFSTVGMYSVLLGTIGSTVNWYGTMFPTVFTHVIVRGLRCVLGEVNRCVSASTTTTSYRLDRAMTSLISRKWNLGLNLYIFQFCFFFFKKRTPNNDNESRSCDSWCTVGNRFILSSVSTIGCVAKRLRSDSPVSTTTVWIGILFIYLTNKHV